MDRDQPPEPESIFSRPAADAESERMTRPASAVPPAPQHGRPAELQAPPVPQHRGPSPRVLAGLGGVGALVLILGGFVAGSLLSPGADPLVAGSSPDSSASLSAPSTSPSPAASASALPSPTPTTATPPPGPDGPTQELVVGGWATVTVGELNIREEPGVQAAARYRLVQGAVVHVDEGPVTGDEGYAWYRIVSLGGARGWVASGTVDSPFATVLTADENLVRCGTVESKVLNVIDGSITTQDPIRIGDLAVPAAAFEDEEIGGLELLRATGGEACVAAALVSGAPSVQAQLNYYACGRPVIDGDLFRLRPAPGMDAVVEYQVKDVAVIHPAILNRDGPDDPMSTNLRAVLRWLALGEDVAGCLNHGINPGPDGIQTGVQIDGKQCGVIESLTSERVVVRAASSAESVTLLLMPGTVEPDLPIGTPTPMLIMALDGINQRTVGVGSNGSVSCS